MKTIADRIKSKRIEKGLSQQDLADKSHLSLRTIQRVENHDTHPREVTIKLLCSVLEINEDTMGLPSKKKDIMKPVMGIMLYSAINLVLMIVVGLFTLDSFATFYSRIAGLLLSFFIPYFIVSRTLGLEQIKRLYKFGSGYIIYVILLFIFQGFEKGFFAGFNTGLFFCIILSVLTLYYGDKLFKKHQPLRQ